MNENEYWQYEDWLESCDAADEQHANDIREDDHVTENTD